MDILTRIVENRKALIKEGGHEMGCAVPEKRAVPLNPFVTDRFLVCEVKRRSPSKGNINNQMDAVAQAKLYAEAGVKSVSVLTEPDFFGGSLTDLMDVKKSFPNLAVLRKDFLICREDIDVSYRAGADAVLLIASILTQEEISDLYAYARAKGLEALVEVHDNADIAKVAGFRPRLTGINCRNLKTFQLDLLHPVKMKKEIKWETDLLFESGIHYKENAQFALSAGFKGMLVGESVVKNPLLIKDLLSVFTLPKPGFWAKLYSRKLPFVKICGITNVEDARKAVEWGADVLGFIFAPSKRKVDPKLLIELKDLNVLKVAVVVAREGHHFEMPPAVTDFLAKGYLDAVQFHGNETPEECYLSAFPYYKAIQIRDENDAELISSYRSPRVLIDAYSTQSRGGTGHQLSDELIGKCGEVKPLWLAGGLGADNVSNVIKEFHPELVDVSSRLESEPGKKNHDLLKSFLEQLNQFKNQG
ncbi:MAG: bifunctional indole-3-glycerol phosphate synthase/phosphoribosylanthranilate isomerase [Spirochaetales bacterium]|nr:bifunctional indole-3-glycerol phosphate synthase/phosphoribosylanthranilate isomerase [Spirochaetales bacterium]